MSKERIPNLESILKNVNPTLLTAENAALKFALEHFEVPDYLQTSTIIEMYGGILTRPGNFIITLSKPNTIPTTRFLRFNVSWLWDTLKKRKHQDLGLYLLPNLPNLPETNNNNEEMVNNNEEIINENQEEVVVEPDNVNDAKVDEKESPEAPNGEETSDDELNTTGTSFTTPRQQNDQIETDEDEESSKSSIASESSSVEDCPPPMPKLTHRSVPLTPTREMPSARVQVDKMMSKTSKTTENSRGRRSIGPKSKCCSVSEDFGGSVKREIPVKKDGSKRTKVETDSDEEPVKKKKSMSTARMSTGGIAPHKRYSLQEEQTMFNYIVKNNLTPRQQNDQSEADEDEESSKSSVASESSSVIVEPCPPPMPKLTPRSVPSTPTREMPSARVQVDRMMSKASKTTENSRERRSIGPKSKCCSVSEDFGGSVKREIPVKKYGSKRTKVETDSDEEPVKKKKSMSLGRKSTGGIPHKRYSLQEEQTMFNYIVKNNLISTCTKSEVSKKLQHLLPGRTLSSILSRTRRLIDRISKITDDPEIIKKFKAVGQGFKDKN